MIKDINDPAKLKVKLSLVIMQNICAKKSKTMIFSFKRYWWRQNRKKGKKEKQKNPAILLDKKLKSCCNFKMCVLHWWKNALVYWEAN